MTISKRIASFTLCLFLFTSHAQAASVNLAIQAVVLRPGYANGFSGLVPKFKPIILYQDGTFTVNVTKAFSSDPVIDGTWTYDADGWQLHHKFGKTETIGVKLTAVAPKAATELNGTYQSLYAASSFQMRYHGTASTISYRSLSFNTQGKMATGGAPISTTGKMSDTMNQADYTLGAYTITVNFPGAGSTMQLFYYYPDGGKHIGIGDATLTLAQ